MDEQGDLNINSLSQDKDSLERQTVCDVCLYENLTQEIITNKCTRCFALHCVHYASPVDPLYCSFCLKDVEITEETLIKKSQHFNEDTKQTYTRTQKARHLVIGGADYLFVNRKINTISDDALGLAIEYHLAIYHALILERDIRKTENFHRNANKSFTVNSTETNSTHEIIVKKVRKTKIIDPKSAEVNLVSTLEALLKTGLKPEDILNLMAAKKK